MSSQEGSEAERLQALLASLVTRRMEESLASVEVALEGWRRGDADVFAAHAEVLHHVERANALSARVAKAGLEGPERLLKDALDAGLLGRDEFKGLTGVTPEEVPSSILDGDGAQEKPTMPDKRSVLEKLLQDGAVLVHIDARREGVKVPGAHREDPKLVLRFGYRLSPPIPDLNIDEEGLRATLMFRGVYFGCVLPWTAIFAIVSEDSRGLIWPEDVPPAAAKDFARADRKNETAAAEPEPSPPSPRRGGHLKLV